MIYFDPSKVPKSILIGCLVIFLALIAFTVVNYSVATSYQIETCRMFGSQQEAQDKYNSNKKRYAKLDGFDHDGHVCESLPKYK